MKAVISSVFHKVVSLFRKLGSSFRKVGSLFGKVGSLFGKVGSLFGKVGSLFGKVSSLFGKVSSFFRNVVSLLDRLVRKLWLLPPCRRIDRALPKTWKGTKPLEYHFLPYVTSVLRVLGWAILIIGVLASILLGLEIMNGGLTVWNTELRGVGIGVSAIVLGIIGSFLAWLFLLVSRELVYLFIHVKENTRNTAQSITEESG
jgi:hypothetical protein